MAANVTWTLGNATANWSSATDWSSSTVPVSGDSVFLNRNNTGNGYTVTLDTLQPVSGSYAALTVGNSEATLGLSVASNTLSVSGGTALSAGNINISNTSTLSTGTFTQSGGTFTQSNGKLSVAGAGATALSVTSGSFTLSGGTVSVTSGASFTGGTEAIQGGAFNTGTLTVGGGALTQSGGTITSSGATALSSGSITVSNSTAKLNTASLAASGGTFAESAGTVAVTGLANFTSGTDTISGGAFNAGTVTVGNALTFSGGTITSGAGGVTVASGKTVTISGTADLNATAGGLTDNGTLTGSGTIDGAISGGGTVTASSGTLDLTGSVNGPVLSVGTVPASDLKIDGAATTTAALSITSVNQTLEIGNAGSLTIGGASAQNVTSGTIKMSGGKLTDANGISFGTSASNGTLSGFGTVAANLTKANTSGAADTITASGGTLDLTGTFGAGLVATIDTSKISDLKFDNTATSAAAISISTGTQMLEVGGSGVLTISAIESITNGTIKLDGGSLTDAAGLTIGAAAQLIGSGVVTTGTTSGTDLEGAGTVTATGAVLDFTKATNLNAAGTAYHVANVAGSVLRFDSTVGTSSLHPTVTFDSSGTGGLGTVDLTHTTLANFHATVNQFFSGDTIDVLSAAAVSLDGTGKILTVKNSGGASLGTITLGESHSGKNFSVNTSTGAITTDMPCFVTGTRILTTTGERMVETLMEGDVALTLCEAQLSAQPVKWIGRRRIDLTAHPHPETVAPIRIRCGAFADNVPHTDLLVSPDHAILVDDKLICARQLINGTTIYQEKDWTSVEYFHVELDCHAILLAEGLPAESYLNTGNHGFFANSDQPLVLHPDLTVETDYPTREAGSCVPFVWDEGSVYPVWRRLAERAEILGRPASSPEMTKDPELRIVVEGRTVRPVHCKNGLYTFALPKGATEIRLVSRAGSPTDVRPWLNDRRSLGVNVERIVLRSEREVRIVPLDQPGLSQGWWPVEQDGIALSRWTNAEAVVSLPSMDGPAMLEIRAGCGEMSYLVTPAQASLAA